MVLRFVTLQNLSQNRIMVYESQLTPDEADIAILRELQQDARISYSELARRIGRSTPTVIERIRKLEDAGIITGSSIRLNLEKLGFGVTALIEVKTDPMRYEKVLEFARNREEIRECYFVTGESSFVSRVIAPSIAHLQELIQTFSMYGSTRTSVVLSSPIIKDFFDLEKIRS
jgi:Lrp/AsnC family transcriptional regulator, leucine-responsive regulatory protein